MSGEDRASPEVLPEARRLESENAHNALCSILGHVEELLTMGLLPQYAGALDEIADKLNGMCDEQQLVQWQACATPLEIYEAGVRKELDDQAAAEMTVHIFEFPDRFEPGARS